MDLFTTFSKCEVVLIKWGTSWHFPTDLPSKFLWYNETIFWQFFVYTLLIHCAWIFTTITSESMLKITTTIYEGSAVWYQYKREKNKAEVWKEKWKSSPEKSIKNVLHAKVHKLFASDFHLHKCRVLKQSEHHTTFIWNQLYLNIKRWKIDESDAWIPKISPPFME